MNELDRYLVGLLTGPDGNEWVSRDDLEQFWWRHFPESFNTRRGRDVFLEAVHYAETGGTRSADLEFRLGGWEIDLSKTAVQAGLVTAFLGGALTVLGADQIPVEVLPTVIPLVFDIRRARLTPGEEYVLAELTMHPDVRDGKLTAAQLYDTLPAQIRDDLSEVDFQDFLDACRRAGVADQQDDGTIALKPVTEAGFRLTIK